MSAVLSLQAQAKSDARRARTGAISAAAAAAAGLCAAAGLLAAPRRAAVCGTVVCGSADRGPLLSGTAVRAGHHSGDRFAPKEGCGCRGSSGCACWRSARSPLFPLFGPASFGHSWLFVTFQVIIFRNLGTRKEGEMSAYSVFNEGARQLPGGPSIFFVLLRWRQVARRCASADRADRCRLVRTDWKIIGSLQSRRQSARCAQVSSTRMQ